MVGSTPVETLDENYLYGGTDSFSFNCNLVYYCGLCNFLFFCCCRTYRRKRWFLNILLLMKKSNYGNMFSWGVWYSYMNDTLMIHSHTFICIIGRSFQYSSIMTIILTLIIRCKLVIWSLLLSTIITGGTKWFTITPTLVRDIFTRSVW